MDDLEASADDDEDEDSSSLLTSALEPIIRALRAALSFLRDSSERLTLSISSETSSIIPSLTSFAATKMLLLVLVLVSFFELTFLASSSAASA